MTEVVICAFTLHLQITVPSLGSVSSTDVRSSIRAGDFAAAAAALHPDVLRYISQRGLYSCR